MISALGQPDNLRRFPDKERDRHRLAATRVEFPALPAVALLVIRHQELHFGMTSRQPARRGEQQRPVAADFLLPRAGQQGDDRLPLRRPLAKKRLVQRPLVDLIEKRMADVLHTDAALRVPFGLERQTGQDEIDIAMHFLDSPRRPGPELRRQIINDGDARRFGFAGDPPVEAGEVDQHDDVRLVPMKIILGLFDAEIKSPQQRQDAENSDDGQRRQRIDHMASDVPHQRTAEAGDAQLRLTAAQFRDEVRRMLIAARLSDRKENVHPCLGFC